MNENAHVGSSGLPIRTDTGQKCIALVPVRLSAFQKELEEAANEPIFIENVRNLDESESDTEDSEDDVSKPKSEITDTSYTAPKSTFTFPTPNSKQVTPYKPKFTHFLTQINESSATTTTTSTFQTPINKLFRTPGFTQEKLGRNTLHVAVNGIKSLSTQDSIPAIKKSLNFNSFVTPTVNRLQSFNTPATAHRPNLERPKKTPISRIAFPKSTVLTAEKKFLELEHEKEKVENKENVCNNKIQWSGQVMAPLEPFETLTVGKVKYMVLNELGKGGSSVVYNCYDPVEKVARAVKKVRLTGDKLCIEGYINEVKMLHKLQHCDRIIKMYAYEIIKEEKVLYVVLEKGEWDLSKILRDLASNSKHLPIHMLMYYWMEMLYAVKQIHENGIIHSDLKPANFLIAPSGLKLIDFGIASSMQADVTHIVKNVQIGTFNYISPEALSNNSNEAGTAEFQISFKSDVWSLGCILYQLVYRKTPFQHIKHTFAKLCAIQDPEQKISYPEADWVPPNIIATTKACLQYNMRSRPSIEDLIKQYENI